MKWLINTIGGFIVLAIEWLVKKIGVKVTVGAFIIPIYVSFIAFMFAFYGYTILFMMKIWNLIKEYFPKAFDYSSASGSFAGLSSHTITSSTMAFLHESGLADAFSNAMNLFLSILSLYFALQLYKVIMYIRKNMNEIITSLFTLLVR
ncbi:hypothetical protein [Campylobacter ureolyticus]|uniref:Membrane protein n=1 Tax=Campylobacter ureolyticus TaxID=827 RepID=A0AAE7JPC2_9BACT|nr:hypothetical protein [Campylobacter ureolyticus]MCR8684261.1 hypothetical protein [Campylobacter ureolyticus]QKF84297.1 putative membrane protein [Campylobacter ureolyticus]QQY35548.1 hypothetical protein I6I59_08530 [Campylobacter ureolyticus]SUX23353.1 Uncharacterised protein [Campylobacter ureolyticus]